MARNDKMKSGGNHTHYNIHNKEYTINHTEGSNAMNTYTTNSHELQTVKAATVTTQAITSDLYTRFIEYLDASPKTIETYTRAVRQFAKWTAEKGITQPTREDVIAYREELKKDHKPSTVQNYIMATRVFFSWTEQEGLYPNVADHVKGAKIDRDHKKGYLTPHQVKKIP